MRKGLSVALVSGGLFAVATVFTAQAMPAAPDLSVQSSGVTKVAACREGWHWNDKKKRCYRNPRPLGSSSRRR